MFVFRRVRERDDHGFIASLTNLLQQRLIVLGKKGASLTSLAVAALGLAMATAEAADEATATMRERCPVVSPRVQQLAEITNTRDKNYNCLGVSIDAKADITGIRFEAHELADDADGVAADIRVKEFTTDEIASEKGAVLDGRPGHDALILRGDIVAGRATETLILQFLYNGITNEFHACRFTLSRGEAGWRLVNAQNDRVPLIVIRTRKVPIIGTFGIQTLEGLCAGN